MQQYMPLYFNGNFNANCYVEYLLLCKKVGNNPPVSEWLERLKKLHVEWQILENKGKQYKI